MLSNDVFGFNDFLTKQPDKPAPLLDLVDIGTVAIYDPTKDRLNPNKCSNENDPFKGIGLSFFDEEEKVETDPQEKTNDPFAIPQPDRQQL